MSSPSFFLLFLRHSVHPRTTESSREKFFQCKAEDPGLLNPKSQEAGGRGGELPLQHLLIPLRGVPTPAPSSQTEEEVANKPTPCSTKKEGGAIPP